MSTAPVVVDGSASEFATDPIAFLNSRHRRYGDVFAVRLGGAPTVIFGGVAGTARLLQVERDHLAVHNTRLVQELYGAAVFNLRGEAHRAARRSLRSALSEPVLQGLAPAIDRLADRHVARWAHHPFDLYQACRTLTMDACLQLLLGLPEQGPTSRAVPAMFDAFVNAGDVSTKWRNASTVYWRGRRARTVLRAMISQCVTEAKDQPGPDVLSQLVANTRFALDPAQIPDHILALMIATRETTASLLTSMLVEMAQHPGVAAESRGESAGVVPAAGSGIAALPWLRTVLLETERRHSPNMLSRRVVLDELAVADVVAPRGWHAAYSPAANHLLAELYADPLRFDPQRFAGDRGRLRAGALLTFGQGLHACPGKHLAEQLVLTVAAEVNRGFQVELPDGAPQQHRYLPVKAPIGAVPAVLRRSRRRT